MTASLIVRLSPGCPRNSMWESVSAQAPQGLTPGETSRVAVSIPRPVLPSGRCRARQACIRECRLMVLASTICLMLQAETPAQMYGEQILLTQPRWHPSDLAHIHPAGALGSAVTAATDAVMMCESHCRRHCPLIRQEQARGDLRQLTQSNER